MYFYVPLILIWVCFSEILKHKTTEFALQSGDHTLYVHMCTVYNQKFGNNVITQSAKSVIFREEYYCTL